MKVPPQAVQDKLSFILNNLTAANLSAKTPELRRLLTQERWPWFCHHLVVRRAAQVLPCCQPLTHDCDQLGCHRGSSAV